MDRESFSYGVAVLVLIVGMAVLVFGVFQGVTESLILIGGVLGLCAVGWMALQASAGH